MPKDLLSVTQVADKVNMSRSTIYTYINKGYLKPDLKLPSGVMKFERATVDKFINSLKMKGDNNE